LAGELGVESTKYSNNGGAYLIIIPVSEITNMRYSTVDTLGSNEWWMPGLVTSGGQYEAVIARVENVLNSKYVIIERIKTSA